MIMSELLDEAIGKVQLITESCFHLHKILDSVRKIQTDCLPGLSGRLAHLQSCNILTIKMRDPLAELNMR